MEDYTQLYLGKFIIAPWVSENHSYLAFIFESHELYVRKNDPQDKYEEVGFSTKCSDAIERLEKYGYTLRFISEIYDFFYNDLFEVIKLGYIEYFLASNKGMDQNKAEVLFWNTIEKIKAKDKFEHIKDFVVLMKQIMRDDYENPERIYQTESTWGNKYWIRKEYDVLDIAELYQFLVHEGSQSYPFWLPMVSLMIACDWVDIYPEIITLVFLRIMLESVEPETVVTLRVNDIATTKEQALLLLSHLSKSLYEKVSLYNKVFAPIIMSEESIRTRIIKDQCNNLLKTCHSATNANEKGKALESLMEVLFRSTPDLQLVGKRVQTGDEEIDLVLKNNVDRPFWIAFQSPLIFIECKNWSERVGVGEISIFRDKIRNHSSQVRLGVFIAIDGYTKESKTNLKRSGVENFHIVLLDESDIAEFIKSSETFYEWFEKKVARLF